MKRWHKRGCDNAGIAIDWCPPGEPRFGIVTGADLRERWLEFLQANFGKSGSWYYRVSRGIDERPVQPNRERKSIGAEDTFAIDIVERDAAHAEIKALVAKVWRHCETRQMQGRTVTLKVKYADFQQVTRSRTIAAPFAGPGDLEVASIALLDTLLPFAKSVRLLGVTVSAFDTGPSEPPSNVQLPLF